MNESKEKLARSEKLKSIQRKYQNGAFCLPVSQFVSLFSRLSSSKKKAFRKTSKRKEQNWSQEMEFFFI